MHAIKSSPTKVHVTIPTSASRLRGMQEAVRLGEYKSQKKNKENNLGYFEIAPIALFVGQDGAGLGGGGEEIMRPCTPYSVTVSLISYSNWPLCYLPDGTFSLRSSAQPNLPPPRVVGLPIGPASWGQGWDEFSSRYLACIVVREGKFRNYFQVVLPCSVAPRSSLDGPLILCVGILFPYPVGGTISVVAF